MLRTQFVVVPYDGGLWRIRSDGRHFGPYTSQREAVRVAIDAAFAAAKNSAHAPRVLVQSGYDNQAQVEWTYGEDPYPPRQ